MTEPDPLDPTVMYENGYSIREIAAAHRVAYGTARKILIQDGVTLRSRGTRNRRATLLTRQQVLEHIRQANQH